MLFYLCGLVKRFIEKQGSQEKAVASPGAEQSKKFSSPRAEKVGKGRLFEEQKKSKDEKINKQKMKNGSPKVPEDNKIIHDPYKKKAESEKTHAWGVDQRKFAALLQKQIKEVNFQKQRKQLEVQQKLKDGRSIEGKPMVQAAMQSNAEKPRALHNLQAKGQEERLQRKQERPPMFCF